MNHRFFLGAYWPGRKESIDQCTDRLATFFAELAKCGEVFSTWYEPGWSRKTARENTAEVSSREYLRKCLDRGRNRRDVGHEVIEDLGFNVNLWNGREKIRAVGIRVTCGLYWVNPTPNASLANYVTLDLPEDLAELRQAERMARVLATAAEAWEPDWAGVMSKEAMNARDWERKPFVDWMVYVPRKITSVPPPSTVTPLKNGGSLIVLQPNPPAVNNPAEQERICRIEQIIRQ